MIGKIVDYALENRFLVVAVAILLFVWGGISFHQLPVEAYPDVANNYVDVIAQWPGYSAEQIEQQVTVPLEIVMNGIPGIAHVRSWSLFGLSTVEMVFGEETTNFENRERVLERLSQVNLPNGVIGQVGTDWSPVGQIYFYTLHSSNPAYDVMALKSIEDWVIEKNLKSVPGVPDTNPFGGPTQEYQVRIDPNKLVSYGLSLSQVEQQLSNNNANGGGSFIQEGLQQINVVEVGLNKDVRDIENTVITSKGGTAVHVRDIGVVEQGPKIRLGRFGRSIRREDGKIIDDDDVVAGIAVLQKGADAQPVLQGIEAKVRDLNDHILPEGVKMIPFIDRSDLLEFTTHTVLHNLTEGIILVVIILLLFLGNISGAIIVALTIPFALLFASACLKLKGIPANLLSLGALDFGMVVDGAVVMVENIVRHLTHADSRSRTVKEKIFEAGHEVQRPVFYAIAIIITAYLPIFTLQSVEGRLFKPMAWTVAFALMGALLFSILIAPVLSSLFFPKGTREWHNPVMTWLTAKYRRALRMAVRFRWVTVGVGVASLCAAIYLTVGGIIGSEFLPHLDEGSLWVRGTLAQSAGPDEGIRVSNQARITLCSFPEATECTSQTGRPDDGTDHTSFFNTEYFVGLKPKEEWRPGFHENKDELIAAMTHELEKMPGVEWGFSQPISDNMEEAVSGVKGQLATKVYGSDLHVLEDRADEIANIMRRIDGITDLAVFQVTGQPDLNYVVDREKAARFQINVADIQDAVQTAVGGNILTEVLQGEPHYDEVMRYLPKYRDSGEAIRNIRLLSPSGERVSLAQLCKVEERDEGSEIYRENNERYVAIKYSVRGRALGDAVREAIQKIAARLSPWLGG
jgi:cobalt-zinc-cadmium resistance protein CzcA